MKFVQIHMSAISLFILLVHISAFSAHSSSTSNHTKSSEILFFDDFEQTDNHDGPFINWMTENIEGWHYWHIVPGQHMRFENTDLKQNDWLVTNQIIGENIKNILINFDVLHKGQGSIPKLFYTNQYNGDASQSNWTEIEYYLGSSENQWYKPDDIIIENPGDTLYFTFHYEAEANQGIYLLLDNFKVQTYTPPAPFSEVGSSLHFEFYTNINGEENFYKNIQTSLENEYNKLSSLWNRPGIQNIFSEDDTIKIYYTEPQDFANISPGLPTWKCGFHDLKNLEIYISPLSNTNQSNYYGNIKNISINEFSQLAISKKFERENNSNFPPYFLEGFGLYEMGIRPQRDSIIKYLNENSVPDFDFLKDTSGISNSLKKDLILSNIEGQVLTPWSYLGLNPGASSFINGQWPHYLEYFYAESEDSRIKLIGETEHFNFYWAESDTMHYKEMTSYFENSYDFYVENYKYQPQHKFNVVICPTETIGRNLTNFNRFNGGAGCGGDLVMQLSPNYNYNEENYYSKWFGYEGMCAHEFFHIYYNHFMWEIPSGFWAEGTADFSGCYALGWETPPPHSLWKIEELFSVYKQKYNAEINLKHISENPNGAIDIYFLGNCFFDFLYKNHGGYENIIKFFNEGMDYSVFNATYEEIDNGYIQYLKSLVNYVPPNVLLSIPFEESFDDFSDGWSKPSYINSDNWQINDGGTNGTNCAKFYTHSDKNVPIESWLISPPLDARDMEQVNLSFDFARYGEGIEFELFYTNSFEEFTDSTNWTSIKKIEMPIDWGWSNSGEITINNPPETLFVGIRKKSTGEQHLQLYIDNFTVKEGAATNNKESRLAKNNFNIYPNPVTNESIFSFQTKIGGNTNLSVFDIQGRKICTLLDENMASGEHTISIGNQMQSNGIYFCKLKTSEGVSTIKLIVNK